LAIKCPKCHSDNPDTLKFCGECGTKLDASASGHPPGPEDRASLTRTLETGADEPTRGTTFAGRYEISEELGRGGMGRVCRAQDTKLNEEVAFKLIKPEIAAERRVVERLQNELKDLIPEKWPIDNVRFLIDGLAPGLTRHVFPRLLTASLYIFWATASLPLSA
jgi:hypothetical protein